MRYPDPIRSMRVCRRRFQRARDDRTVQDELQIQLARGLSFALGNAAASIGQSAMLARLCCAQSRLWNGLSRVCLEQSRLCPEQRRVWSSRSWLCSSRSRLCLSLSRLCLFQSRLCSNQTRLWAQQTPPGQAVTTSVLCANDLSWHSFVVFRQNTPTSNRQRSAQTYRSTRF